MELKKADLAACFWVMRSIVLSVCPFISPFMSSHSRSAIGAGPTLDLSLTFVFPIIPTSF